jgi:N-methylhydantoinase A
VISELAPIDAVSYEHVAELFERLRAAGECELREQGFPSGDLRYEYRLDLRYVGQGYDLTIEVPEIPRAAAALAETRARFDAEHDKLTGHSAPGERVEIVNYRVTAVAGVPHASIASPFVATTTLAGARVGTRTTRIDGVPSVTDLYDRTKLSPGAVIDGPAILLQHDSTTVIHSGQSGRVVEFGQVEIAACAARNGK